MVRVLRIAALGLGSYLRRRLFGATVVLPVTLGILLIIYGVRGHLAVIGIGVGMVGMPLLGWWVWSRYADRVEQRDGSAEPSEPAE